jgi:hypothetical protein
MNGSDFYTAVQSLVSGFSIDTTLFYQMLNNARIRRELQRPWMVLRKYQYSQTINAQSFSSIFPPAAQATIPTDFQFFTRDGEITLYNNNNQWETYLEVPLNLAIPYMQDSNKFFMDYNAGIIYFCGNIATSYTIFLQYQANLGDITANTTWLNFPSWAHMILAYDVAAMYRLGIDYDDINARNADQNNRDAQLMMGALIAWDDNRQRSATTRMDMPPITDVPGASFNKKIDMSAG